MSSSQLYHVLTTDFKAIQWSAEILSTFESLTALDSHNYYNMGWAIILYIMLQVMNRRRAY